MSFKPEVIADKSGKWAGNGLAFATQEEALAYAKDLAGRAEWCDREGGCFCKFRNVACSNYVAASGVQEGRNG